MTQKEESYAQTLGAEVVRAMEKLDDVLSEMALFRGILKQSVLTHGGELRIDPHMASAAANEPRLLEISAGGVRLVDMPR